MDASPACYAILLLIVGLSLIGLMGSSGFIERNLLRPYWLMRGAGWHTPVTSAFVHASLPHLLFNCMTLWAFGPQLEQAMGTAQFAGLYAFGLAGSTLRTVLKHRADPEYRTLGASGAVLAVLFASIIYFPHSSIYILPLPFPIPAPLFALVYTIYSIHASRQAQGTINHDAHLGGAIAGVLYVGLLDPQRLHDFVVQILG